MRPAAEEEEQPASEHALLSERTRVRINRRFVKTGKMERLERKKKHHLQHRCCSIRTPYSNAHPELLCARSSRHRLCKSRAPSIKYLDASPLAEGGHFMKERRESRVGGCRVDDGAVDGRTGH